MGPRSHVSAMGVSEVKDLLLALPRSARKTGAPSIRVLCEWVGKHDTPARTGGSRGLFRLRKNSSQERFLKGHEFTRADKSIGLTPALAAEGGISQFFPELFTFSAARLGLGKVSSNAKTFRPGPHPDQHENWMPRPFAFFANGWESTTLQLAPEGSQGPLQAAEKLVARAVFERARVYSCR